VATNGNTRRMKISVRKGRVRGELAWVVDWKPPGGKRRRQFYGSRTAAEAWAAQMRLQTETAGAVWSAMPAAERNELLAVAREVRAAGLTLREVWEGCRRTPQVPLVEVTLEAALDECAAAKRAANRRPAYVAKLKHFIRQLIRGREAMPPTALGTDEILAWLDGKGYGPSARKTYRGAFSVFFSFCEARGYVRQNPVKAVPSVTVDRRTPRILSVEEARQSLSFAQEHQPRFLATLVLGVFTGIRPEEIAKMQWGMIDLDQGIIRLAAEVTKDRRPRLIYLMPGAQAWLREAKALRSALPLPHQAYRRALRRQRRHLGLARWPQDLCRHTAASYLLAHYQDAGRVALELGNSPQVLLTHYREIVTREEAKKFWALRPRGKTG
jgi:integrase/recombinase XerD